MFRCAAMLIVVVFLAVTPANANSTYVAGGDIPGGLWLKQLSPYVVLDTIRLTNSNTLYIEYGCEILFNDDVVFYIESQAKLVAGVGKCPGAIPETVWFAYLGTKGDSIVGWDGLRFNGAADCTLKGCHISGVVNRNASEYGAVFCYNSSVDIENCIICDNYGGGNGGGGVFFQDNRRATLKNCSIMFNKSYGDGGGIYIDSDDSTEISGNYIAHNELFDGTKNGGGAYLKAATVFSDNEFISNRSRRDGGGLFVDNYNGIIARPKTFDNIAHRRGGGIAVNACSPTILEADVCGNFALAVEGAAVYFQENSAPTMVNCIVTRNDGGGVWSAYNTEGTCVKLINCTIAKNNLGPGLRVGHTFAGSKLLLLNTAIAYNSTTYPGCKQVILESSSDLYVNHSFVDNPIQVCNDGSGTINYLDPPAFITGSASFADTTECTLGWLPSCAPVMSALIDAGGQYAVVLGDTVWAPSIDFLGNTRFIDAGYDIGAFENGCLGSRETKELPKTSSLLSARPNPFNSTLTIEFQAAENSDAGIEVFDMSGRRVADVWRGRVERGFHTKAWNSGDLPSGVYNIRLAVGGEVFIEKVSLLK